MNEKNIHQKIKEKNIEIPTTKDIIKQEILFYISEYNNKLAEYKIIQENISKTKVVLSKLITEYTIKKNSVIEKEKENEALLIKISKLTKNLLISINKAINKKFYEHLKSILGDKQKEKLLIQFFNFSFNLYNLSKYFHFHIQENINFDIFGNFGLDINENQEMRNILRILRDEYEIKNLILYSKEIIQNLSKESIIVYNKIKDVFSNLYNEIKKEGKQYPIDLLFDFLNNIFNIINYEKQVEDMKILINNLTLEKNDKFIKIKNLEILINGYITNKKIISNYIKELNDFLIKIKKKPEKKFSENIDELKKDIEKIKNLKVNYDKLNNNFNNAASLFEGNKEFKNNLDKFDNLINNKENLNQKEKKNLDEVKVNKENYSTNYLVKKNEKVKYEKINKIYIINGNHDKTRNRSNNLKRSINGNGNNIKSFNYKTMYNNISLNTKKNFQDLSIHKTKPKQNEGEKKFNEIYKNININNVKESRNRKDLMKNKIDKKYYKSTQENKINRTLNNIIFKNIIKEPPIKKNNKNKNTPNIILNNQSRKNKISNQNCFGKNISKKNEQFKNISNQQKEEGLLKNNKTFLQNEIKNENKQEKEEQIKQNEQKNSIEITRPNQENNYNDENAEIDEIKDSICDEIGSKKLSGGNYLIVSNTNSKNYINKLGIQQNIIWSENIYKNKNIQYKPNNKQLNIEKKIDAFSCCASCT
jgi:hypothetical protein